MVQVLLSPCLTAHDALLCYEEVCLTLPSGLSLPLGSRIDVKLSITTSGGCKIPLGLGLAKRPPQVWENRVFSWVLASFFGTSWGLLGGPVHKGNLASGGC